MSTTTKYITKLAIVLGLIFALSTCKKYPENIVWFKNIKKIKFFDNVKITSYKINGDENINTLNSFFGSKITVKDFSSTFITESYDSKYGNNIPVFIIPNKGFGSYNVPFFYSYSKNKKKIEIFYDINLIIDTTIYTKSLFVSEITKWDIIKFVPNGTRKIKSTINGNIYEMQFEKL